jgi:hypothetical protein
MPVRPKVDVGSSLFALYQSSIGELLQLPLHGSDARAYYALNLPKVEAFFRIAVKKRQDIAAYGAEKETDHSVGLDSCYHLGYKCNL